MQRVLGLTTVTDGYMTFPCPGSTVVSIQVFNNGVDVGFGAGFPAVVYPPSDEYLALTSANLSRRCDEIRFKNHVAGKPAMIQITTQGAGDVQAPLADSYSSNFLTINPDGTVGASFTGTVNAQGVTLPSDTVNPGASPPPPGNAISRITWQRQSDGALLAELTNTSYNQGGILDETDLWTYRQAGTDVEALTRVGASDSNQQNGCEVRLVSTASEGQVQLFAGIGGTYATKVLLDGSGNSNYAQSVNFNTYIVGGAATCTFNGSSGISNPTNIGTTVPFVNGAGCLVTAAAPNNGIVVYFGAALYQGGNPATFNVYAISPGGVPSNGFSVSVYWLAYSW